jgi:hypothetical protein
MYDINMQKVHLLSKKLATSIKNSRSYNVFSLFNDLLVDVRVAITTAYTERSD